MSTTTRERIVDEAMHLFSQHGYAATSIAKIEAAVGLTREPAASTTTSRARKRWVRMMTTALADPAHA